MGRRVLSGLVVACVFQGAVAQSFSTRNDYRNQLHAEAGLYLMPENDDYQIIQIGGDTMNSFYRICVARVTSDGEVVERRSFGRDSLSCFAGWAAGPSRTSAGALVCFGATDDGDRIADRYWLFDSDLDSLWSLEVYPDSADQSQGFMTAANSTSLFGVGSVFHSGEAGQMFLVKLDTTGQVLWTREYGGTYRDEGWSMDTTADGGFILGGWSLFNDTNYDAYIVKTDSLGNEEWHRYLGGSFRDGFSNVITTANGEYLSVGADATAQTQVVTVFKPYAARLDASGDILWQRSYGSQNSENEFNTAKELADGSFIACGTYHTGSRTAGMLARIAANGDSLWMRTYVHPPLEDIFSYHTLYDVIQDSAGYFVSCGSCNDGQQDLWVLRVDSFGCLVPGCQLFDDIAERDLDFNVLLYPNPANDRLFLSFRSAQAPTGEFTLLNSAGKVVRRFSPGGASVELEVDVFAQLPGLYVLRYQDREGVRWSEKLVIE